MVAVVQLVEHQVVILGVAGSSPVSHPHERGSDIFVNVRVSFFLSAFPTVPWPASSRPLNCRRVWQDRR